MIIVSNSEPTIEATSRTLPTSTNSAMSNTKNNNLPVQNMVSSAGIGMDSPSGSSTANRSQRSPHEGSTFQRRRAGAGRSGHRGRAAARRGGQMHHNSGQPNDGFDRHSQADHPNLAPTMDNDVAADGPNDDTSRNVSSANNTSRGHHRGPNNRAAVGSGKYRQRQHTSQLIDGMESLTGLDIDLAESIVPTSSVGRDSDPNKRRHATNSRKMNLTHLLNYKFEAPKNRSNKYSSGQANSQRNSSSQYRDPGTNHKFSKQQFLQANCQFVVSDGHDYTIHKVDPDWPVDWNCIEEVRFMQCASSETTCPICLEPPIAAKITRCGHIYCWTCMLHYLSLSDENCRQCPICFEPVYRSDLRSVISHSFTNYSIDDEIVMRLMIRKKGRVEAEPYNNSADSPASPSPNYVPDEGPNGQCWSRANLVIVDPQTVVSKIALRERNELEFKLGTNKGEPEVCFVEQALELLEKRVSRLFEIQATEPNKAKTQDCPSSNRNRPIGPGSSLDTFKSYLFYQCIDNQHIYLNPFSTKVLCHEYGSLENCPLELRAKILQMDWISMNEAWRKRFRYLGHLPLTCEFRLIEIDFEKSNLISSETYKVFEDQIKWREQEREKRRREERKREKIIQVQQNRKIYGIQPSLKINLNSNDQFPSVSDERYLGLTQPRSQTRPDDYDYYSSDDDDLVGTLGDTTRTDHNEQPAPTEPNIEERLSDQVIASVATSFRDIQLQEAALEAKQKSKTSTANQSAWGSKKSASSSTQQSPSSSSSFAQLLVNAKSSQKQWTKNATSSRAPQSTFTDQGTISSNPTTRQRLISGSDDGGEELRAPPFECTISDFIDMNIISSKKKGKKKG